MLNTYDISVSFEKMERFEATVIEPDQGPIGFVGMFAIRDRRAQGPNPWAQGHLYKREATAKAYASLLNVKESAR